MLREDFRSTDLAGAAHYARLFDAGTDPLDDSPTRRELSAEFDQAVQLERDQIRANSE